MDVSAKLREEMLGSLFMTALDRIVAETLWSRLPEEVGDAPEKGFNPVPDNSLEVLAGTLECI